MAIATISILGVGCSRIYGCKRPPFYKGGIFNYLKNESATAPGQWLYVQ